MIKWMRQVITIIRKPVPLFCQNLHQLHYQFLFLGHFANTVVTFFIIHRRILSCMEYLLLHGCSVFVLKRMPLYIELKFVSCSFVIKFNL